MQLRTLTAAVGAAVLLAAAPGAGADPLYDLSFLPAGFAASQLNNAGQIVGTSSGAAAILSGGVVSGVAGVGSPSAGLAINNHGDVAGSLGPLYGGSAFSSIGGTLTNIGAALPADYTNSYASAINDHGAVGGVAIPPVGEGWRGFIYQGGSFQNIGTFGGDYSILTALNNDGAATGYAALAGPVFNEPEHAFYFHSGTLQDLGTLGGDYSHGNDLNNAGNVVGWAQLAGDVVSHPFLYSHGSLLDLGTLGGTTGAALAINNFGAIVGNSLLADGSTQHAFLYQSGKLVDLNGLVTLAGGWRLTDAYDINDAGQILGTACLGSSCSSVLLSPVPEPASGALLLAGLGVLALGGRRKVADAFRNVIRPA